MVHDLQLAQALNAGAAITEVRAVGVPVLSPRVDLANVRLEFANGCVATLTASRVSGERVRKLRLFEPDAYHSIDYTRAERLRLPPAPRHAGADHRAARRRRWTRPSRSPSSTSAFQRACLGLGGAFVDGGAGAAALAAAVAVTTAINEHIDRH